MAKVHFEIGGDNEDLKRKLKESEDAILGLQKTAENAGQGMDAALSGKINFGGLTSAIESTKNELSLFGDRAEKVRMLVDQAFAGNSENAKALARVIQDENDKVWMSYQENLRIIQETETTYEQYRAKLESMRNEGFIDEATFAKSSAELEKAKAELDQVAATVEKTADSYQNFGLRMEEAINKINPKPLVAATQELSAEQETARQREALAKQSTKELAQAYISQRVAVSALTKDVAKGNTAKQQELDTESKTLRVIQQVLFEKAKGRAINMTFTDMLFKENMATKESTAYKEELKNAIHEVGTA